MIYRIQLIFDLRRRVAFQEQIFNDSSSLDFVLNSLKQSFVWVDGWNFDQ